MKKNKLPGTFAFLSLSFGAVWFGSYVTKVFMLYNLFEEGELILKWFINSSNLSGIIEALIPLFYITFITYVILIICLMLFIVTTKLKYKENGWLFIVTVIVYFTFPFEVILMVIDYKIIVQHISNNLDSDFALTMIKERLQMLSSFPVIIILSYFSIPYFLIFKPFSKKTDK